MRWTRWPAVLALAFLAATAQAWSNKEHMLLTRLAAMRLLADPATPPAMKQWLREAVVREPTLAGERAFFLKHRVGLLPNGAAGLAFWATYPDMMALADKRERKLDYFNVPEGKLHYLDVEYFHPDAAKRKYADDLSARPAGKDFPRSIDDERYAAAGMLPFAVEHSYRQLVKNLKAGRLVDKPGQFPRDEHAARWAGCLAHYAQDNFQPHHATEDYKSRSYFKADPKKAPDIHSDMEYRLVDDDDADHPEFRAELWELLIQALDEVKEPVPGDDPWQQSLRTSLMSYAALPMIGQAARKAYPAASDEGPGAWNAAAFFHHKGTYMDREITVIQMKALQLAMAVHRTERLWRKAWDEARE